MSNQKEIPSNEKLDQMLEKNRLWANTQGKQGQRINSSELNYDSLMDKRYHAQCIDPVLLGESYKRNLEKCQRNGKPTSEMGSRRGEHSRASQYRYKRLTYLIPDLQVLASNQQLGLVAGSRLSFLSTNSQQLVADAIKSGAIKIPNQDKAKAIRELYDCGNLNFNTLLSLY